MWRAGTTRTPGSPRVLLLLCCYESVLTCINYCRSIVVIVYSVLSIVVILINIILVMCDIDSVSYTHLTLPTKRIV